MAENAGYDSCMRKPPEFLNVGDVMEDEIEKIGVLRNRVVNVQPLDE